MTTARQGIADVISVAGSASAVAAIVGAPVKRQNVEHWVKAGRVPPEHCPALELALDLPCERIRPDLKWRRVRARGWKKGKPLLDVTRDEAAVNG